MLLAWLGSQDLKEDKENQPDGLEEAQGRKIDGRAQYVDLLHVIG